jgi:hypothetical protein
MLVQRFFGLSQEAQLSMTQIYLKSPKPAKSRRNNVLKILRNGSKTKEYCTKRTPATKGNRRPFSKLKTNFFSDEIADEKNFSQILIC